jgi:proline iminopeptidase
VQPTASRCALAAADAHVGTLLAQPAQSIGQCRRYALEAFESLRIKTSGATLAVRQYAGNGAPILLLHGGPGFGDYLSPVAEMLSPPHWVISYDQRGCGQSSRDGAYHFREHVEDLNGLRKHLAVDKIHIFGHSWGGMLAQLYAKTYPQNVASLVLCCSIANTGKRFAAMEQKALNEHIISKARSLTALGWLIVSLVPGLEDRGYRNLIRMVFPYYFVEPDKAPQFQGASGISKRGNQRTMKSIDEADDRYLEQLPLDAPVLIIQGRQDVFREANALLVERFRRAKNAWIEEAGHFVWLERPDVFRETLLTFYQEHVTASLG